MPEKREIIIGHFKQGKSQRQISREMGISRRTVKKYITEYQTEREEGTGSLRGVKQLINARLILHSPMG